MKKTIVGGVITFAFTLLTQQIAQAQGMMTYISSLSQTNTGSVAVGSDSWMAAGFGIGGTGSNPSGYVLNSIQLGMADASGNPTNFMVMLYKSGVADFAPGQSLGTLEGSLNPVAGGIFTYTSVTNIILYPGNYYIVLTAGTTIANGAYSWSESAYPPTSTGGWHAGVSLTSSDGSSWNFASNTYPQFAIDATAIPEPGVLSLFGLGGLAFLWHRRKAKAVR